MDTMIIDVTQEDINEALRRRSDKTRLFQACMDCPIAVALQRQTYLQVVVAGRIELRNAELRSYATYRWTPEMHKAIFAFDTGNEVKPFSFELEV